MNHDQIHDRKKKREKKKFMKLWHSVFSLILVSTSIYPIFARPIPQEDQRNTGGSVENPRKGKYGGFGPYSIEPMVEVPQVQVLRAERLETLPPIGNPGIAGSINLQNQGVLQILASLLSGPGASRTRFFYNSGIQ